MPKRNDATYVYDIQPFKKIFPYLMPRKCDSLVYLNCDLDLSETLLFIKNNPSPTLNRKYRVFEIMIAALIRLFVLRPELNRFLMNKKLWQRNDISLNFVVKRDYSDDSPEHSVILKFDPNMTLDEIANYVDKKIEETRSITDDDNNNKADKLIDFFTSFPPFITSFFVSIIKFLDIKGIAPLSITEEDGLHCSAYLSNLGSIGLRNGKVQHHLYQWGTTSIFMTIGSLKRKRIISEEGLVRRENKLEVGFTIDERISDGYYFIKSLNILQDLINKPDQLLTPSKKSYSKPPKNKKEYKLMNKAKKQEEKS
ncbi:MAG: 2-oxoacid:acceptor oxidoreductase [Pleomorphochaeta sp.]